MYVFDPLPGSPYSFPSLSRISPAKSFLCGPSEEGKRAGRPNLSDFFFAFCVLAFVSSSIPLMRRPSSLVLCFMLCSPRAERTRLAVHPRALLAVPLIKYEEHWRPQRVLPQAWMEKAGEREQHQLSAAAFIHSFSLHLSLDMDANAYSCPLFAPDSIYAVGFVLAFRLHHRGPLRLTV